MELSERHRDVLRHTLTGSGRTDEVYRNYFAADPSHHGWVTLRELVAAGLMVEGERVRGQPYIYFHCTKAGAAAVGLHLVPERRWPASPV